MALVEGCKHAIEVVIPAAVVEEETGKVAETIRARAQLQGFRPGKAPLSMIRSRYGREIRQEALENLLPKFFRKEVEKDHLDVVGSPNITNIEYEAGQDVKFKAEFEVAPTVELQEYRGVTVTYQPPVVAMKMSPSGSKLCASRRPITSTSIPNRSNSVRWRW